MGLFLLYYNDFNYNNIIFNNKYCLFKIINWKIAFIKLYKMLNKFFLFILIVLSNMDVSQKYNKTNNLKKTENKQRFIKKEDYIIIIK